jgi:hypothetical protein
MVALHNSCYFGVAAIHKQLLCWYGMCTQTAVILVWQLYTNSCYVCMVSIRNICYFGVLAIHSCYVGMEAVHNSCHFGL